MEDRPDFTLERLGWEDEPLGSIDLPAARLSFTRSFGSGLARRAGDPPGRFWAVGDRGPNLKIRTLVERYGAAHLAPLESLSGAKVMPRLDIGPRFARLHIAGDRVELIESFAVTDEQGGPVSGLPMPGSEHCVSEPALDMAGAEIAPDPSGLDSEGIAALDDGTFILSEEFGPSLVQVDAEGRVLARHVPEGTDLADARYPIRHTLPAIAARRQLNRGFEAITVSGDRKWLFVAFQSPLAHPDEPAHRRARHVRIWRIDAAEMKVDAQYLYPLDPPETFVRDSAKGQVDRSDLKISEMVWLPGGDLLVLERGSETTKIYRVGTQDAPLVPDEHLDPATRPTLEEMSAAGDILPCLAKTLLFSSDDAPELSADLEGMAILSPTELLLVNDNDFGVEGASTAFWRVNFREPLLG